MAVHKTEKADIRKRYPLYVQVGLVLALGSLILAFRADLSPGDSFEIVEVDQEIIQIEDVLQTSHFEKPPPPPRPPVPVEGPDDEILEDDLDLDASLDIDEAIVDLPLPPPAQEEEEEPEFQIVEEMPELIGGMAALLRTIEYPEIAKKAGVEGRVFVQFVVNEQGEVVDPVVVRGIGAGCDEEALRAVSQAKFKPGKQRGKPVRVKMSLPVTFELR